MTEVSVKKIIFRNKFTNNTIFLGEDKETYIGYFPIIEEGFKFKLEFIEEVSGQFNKKQRLVTFCEFPIIDDVSLMHKFLTNEQLTGILSGKKADEMYSLVRLLATKVGINYFKIFKDLEVVFTKLRLTEKNTTSKSNLKILKNNLINLEKSYANYNFFVKYGLEVELSNKIAFSEYKFYKPLFETDPYSLFKHFEIEWRTLDGAAQKNGIDKESSIRLEGAITYAVLEEMKNNAHICGIRNEVLNAIPKLTGFYVSKERFDEVISNMIKNKKIIPDNGDKLYIPEFFKAENDVAFNIIRLIQPKEENVVSQIDDIYDKYKEEKPSAIELAESQENAVRNFNKHKMSILLGPAGSGKTTTLNQMINFVEYIEYQEFKKKKEKGDFGEYFENQILLVAPTGMAKEQMRTSTGREASTLHSVLGISEIYYESQYNVNNPLKKKYVFLDEFSMVDTRMFSVFLNALPDDVTLVLIGDVNQLPSIAAGSVLFEMLQMEDVPLMELDCIFRQGAGSKIVELSQHVSKGYPDKIQQTFLEGENELLLLNTSQQNQIKYFLEVIFKQLISTPDVDIYKDLQILSPLNIGELGIRKLNEELQRIFLEYKGVEMKKKAKFYLFDKVMQIRNDSEKKVYNGERGQIIQVNKNGDVTVEFNSGKKVEYTKSEVSFSLELSYCTTIHKMQGSESSIIIMLMHYGFQRMLETGLLYTGVTRAKKRYILIGDLNVFKKGVRLNKTPNRRSYIRVRKQENKLKFLIEKRTQK